MPTIWGGAHLAGAPLSFAQRVAAKRAAAEAQAAAAFAAGYTPAAGSLAGKTLQVRNEVDRSNWLTSQATYKAAIDAGQGATPGARFRTMSNETVWLTFQEGYDVLVFGMAAWGEAIYGNLWDLKDALDALADGDEAGLAAVDVEAGWP